MAERKINFGILGVARINRKIVPAIQRSPYAELHAIGSRDRAKANAYAKEHSIPKAYGSYEEVLSDSQIDAVYIPLPNTYHLEWVKKAAKAKKHILCEKPLGLTAQEVEEAIQVCKSEGVLLLDGFMWPHHPRTTTIKELLNDKHLGEIRHVNCTFTFPLDLSKPDIRKNSATGGGSLYDVGCYCVKSALYVFNEPPRSVWATAHWQNNIDFQMTTLLEFSNGATASLHFGFLESFNAQWEILGQERRMNIIGPWAPGEEAPLEIWKGSELEERLTFPPSNQIYKMIDGFSQAILAKEKEVALLDSALPLAKTIDALYESARTGKKIEL